MGRLRITLPIIPVPESSGQKAATVVRTAKITGRPSSVAPSTAALRGLKPSSRFRKIFSPMTMASSTTMPSTIISAKSEIMFIDTSKSGKSHNPARKEIGIPRVTQKASCRFKKSPSRMLTRIRPMAMFFSSRSIRLFSTLDIS